QVAVNAFYKRFTDLQEQFRTVLHNTTADENPPRRCGEQQRLQQLRERMSDRLPDRAVRRELAAGNASPRCNCRPGGQSLNAVAVELADARPSVARQSCYPYVSQFRMITSKHGCTGNDQTNTYTGTDGDVRVVLQATRGSPTSLRKCRAVYVGI